MTAIAATNTQLPLNSRVIIGSGDAAKANLVEGSGPTPEEVNNKVRQTEDTLENRRTDNSNQQLEARANISETYTAIRQKELVELYISLSSDTDTPDSRTEITVETGPTQFEELLEQLQSEPDAFMEQLKNQIDKDYRNPIDDATTPEALKGTILDIQV